MALCSLIAVKKLLTAAYSYYQWLFVCFQI